MNGLRRTARRKKMSKVARAKEKQAMQRWKAPLLKKLGEVGRKLTPGEWKPIVTQEIGYKRAKFDTKHPLYRNVIDFLKHHTPLATAQHQPTDATPDSATPATVGRATGSRRCGRSAEPTQQSQYVQTRMTVRQSYYAQKACFQGNCDWQTKMKQAVCERDAAVQQQRDLQAKLERA